MAVLFIIYLLVRDRDSDREERASSTGQHKPGKYNLLEENPHHQRHVKDCTLGNYDQLISVKTSVKNEKKGLDKPKQFCCRVCQHSPTRAGSSMRSGTYKASLLARSSATGYSAEAASGAQSRSFVRSSQSDYAHPAQPGNLI